MDPALALHETPLGRLLTAAVSWALVPATRLAGAPEIDTAGAAVLASDTVADCGLSGKLDEAERAT